MRRTTKVKLPSSSRNLLSNLYLLYHADQLETEDPHSLSLDLSHSQGFWVWIRVIVMESESFVVHRTFFCGEQDILWHIWCRTIFWLRWIIFMWVSPGKQDPHQKKRAMRHKWLKIPWLWLKSKLMKKTHSQKQFTLLHSSSSTETESASR